LYDDFVIVSTFLFLTMQGTPEARRLRRELGLTRTDIEHYKLDHLFTLALSDVGEDPELNTALARCGCGHLLGLLEPAQRFSWLSRFSAPLRRVISPFRVKTREECHSVERGGMDVVSMIEHAKKSLKTSQGWTI
jgi:hypothetical protein